MDRDFYEVTINGEHFKGQAVGDRETEAAAERIGFAAARISCFARGSI